jgi:UDP:flavonoid glycosyltransferase YjiC (YdhE family)
MKAQSRNRTLPADFPLVVFYVSGHGFGHAARCGAIIRELRRQASAVRVMVRTSSPAWLYPDAVQHVPLQTDVGVLQVDSLTILVDETIRQAAEFEQTRPRLLQREVAALSSLNPRVIVADTPPVAFDVAAELGIPGLALGNFSWDWIYAGLGSTRPEVDDVVAGIVASEQRATLLLRLPFHHDMQAFPRREDVPLVAEVSALDRDTARRQFNLPLDRPIVLISYGGLGVRNLDVAALAGIPEVFFVTTAAVTGEMPDNLLVLPPTAEGYADLLRASDAVMMKPGYGTVADCTANQVPMIYTRRHGFPEEDILVAAMEHSGHAVALPAEELSAGRIRSAVEQALASGRSWNPVRADGAAVIARRLIEQAGVAVPFEGTCDELVP